MQELKPTQENLRLLLGEAPAADLTALKTAIILERGGIQKGHQLTGFILCHPETGERCLVEMSACRWLTRDESWKLMHP